jgi:hypothetical protein
MNASKPDPFENRLASQPLRRPPPEWRNEILAAAMRSQSAFDQLPTSGIQRGFFARLSEFLWPSPVAWGGLAATWLALLAFSATTPAGTMSTAKAPPVSAEQLRYAFRDQNQLLKELIGPQETTEPARRPAPATKPRSELKASYGRA